MMCLTAPDPMIQETKDWANVLERMQLTLATGKSMGYVTIQTPLTLSLFIFVSFSSFLKLEIRALIVPFNFRICGLVDKDHAACCPILPTPHSLLKPRVTNMCKTISQQDQMSMPRNILRDLRAPKDLSSISQPPMLGIVSSRLGRRFGGLKCRMLLPRTLLPPESSHQIGVDETDAKRATSTRQCRPDIGRFLRRVSDTLERSFSFSCLGSFHETAGKVFIVFGGDLSSTVAFMLLSVAASLCVIFWVAGLMFAGKAVCLVRRIQAGRSDIEIQMVSWIEH
ncbi:hypothetical protein QQ045_026931 [Rhodiola kirilowii]